MSRDNQDIGQEKHYILANESAETMTNKDDRALVLLLLAGRDGI